MTTAARIEMLQRMPVFGALSDDAIAFLLEIMRSVVVPAQHDFFREDDPATGIYVLEQGSASVLKGWQGRQFLLHRLGPGDCFGEMALMDLKPRSATVRADGDCRALLLRSDDLMRLYEHDLEQFTLIQMNLAREVSRRLRDTDERLFELVMARELPPPPPEWGGQA